MMRIIAVLMLLVIATAGFADDQIMTKATASASGEVSLASMHAINNVVAVKDGKQTALCGCGKEFEVTAETPVMKTPEGIFYCCGPACHEHAMKSTPEEMQLGMASWQKMMDSRELVTNAAMKDGKKMATCACGMDFEVKASCPYVLQDGMKVYTCCDGCSKHCLTATPEERTKMLQKAMHTVSK